MKQYFAKYLPVEGEIQRQKGGMKAFDPKGILQHIAGDVSLKLLPNLNEKYKKAQLFLCSRDIKEGDKVWWCGIGYNWFEEELKGIWENQRKTFANSKGGTGEPIENIFKVIGPISPEAT